MRVRDFRDLEVWKEAVNLSAAVYKLTRRFPVSEQFGITAQVRDAVVSVSSNIAEGNGRGSRKDYARFLMNSKGSLNEVLSLLAVACRLEIVSASDVRLIEEDADRVGRMLMGLRSSLLRSAKRPK